MKTLSKFIVLLPVFGLLSACGFQPIYGSHHTDMDSPTAMDLNNVAIDNISDRLANDADAARNGQMLRNDLIDRMYGKNRPQHPRYRLSVKIHYIEQDLGIQANATSTRELLDMYADYSLIDNAPDYSTMSADAAKPPTQTLISGTAHSIASFDRLDQMYGTVGAREDAYQRTIHEVSEQIVNRVSLYFAERPQ